MKKLKITLIFIILIGCMTSCKSRIVYDINVNKTKLELVGRANSYYIMKATIDSSEYLIVSGGNGIAIIRHK